MLPPVIETTVEYLRKNGKYWFYILTFLHMVSNNLWIS